MFLIQPATTFNWFITKSEQPQQPGIVPSAIQAQTQNTTSDQMLMFLTRLGYDSKPVITGDITQVDLPPDRPSGLVEARDILRNIDGIAFCAFTEQDVVRHPLVRQVIRAYEQRNRERGEKPEQGHGQR